MQDRLRLQIVDETRRVRKIRETCEKERQSAGEVANNCLLTKIDLFKDG